MHRILTILGAAAIFAVAVGAIMAMTAVAMALPIVILHAIGADTQASRQYAFLSAPAGPLVAVLGYSSLLGVGLRHVNCHYRRCWRIGRHHIGGQVWCHKHQELARPERTDADRLEEILTELQRISGQERM